MMNARYIDLYGFIKKFLHQNENVVFFVFEDEYYGDLYCKAGKDTSFHFKNYPNADYHLQVVLEGIPFNTRRGIESINNQLFVKKVNQLSRRNKK